MALTLFSTDSPLIGRRVAILPHRDEWMQGDRFGHLVAGRRVGVGEYEGRIRLDSGRVVTMREEEYEYL